MRLRAYTLVELLAVVILLGLIAGLGVPALVRTAQGDPLEQTCTSLRRAVTDLRRFACGPGCQVELAMDGWISSNRQMPTFRAHPTIRLTWLEGDGHKLRRLVFDHRGRSTDWQVEVRQDNRQKRYRISGISGEWWETSSESTSPSRAR